MSKFARCLTALLLAAVLCGCGVLMLRAGFYGYSVFLMTPFFLGALAAWAVRAGSPGRAVVVGAAAPMLASLLLLFVSLEGAVCIVISWPLIAPLGALGGWLAYREGSVRFGPGHITALLLLPGSLTWDVNARPPVFEVRTALEIAAPPERVWKNVVTFSELPEPREWFFRAGIAYPKRARIEGIGPGAVRYCEFSTGPFVEPIEVWQEPRLLRFRVTESPAPMNEWSPYAQVQAKHLHGYLVARQGEFLLTPLSSGRTLLQGTTWYQHGLWPADYWRWWSDAIIHRIHLRVLTHIRALSEWGPPEQR